MDYEDRLATTYTRFLESGDIVIDVGAYVGRHSKNLLDAVGPEGRVFCFEPLPESFIRLAIDMLDKPNVTLMHMALGETRGVVDFVEAVGAPEESGLKKRHLYNSPHTTSPTPRAVWCDTLDHMCGDLIAPRYIKIDVEGAELAVLKGGDALVRRCRPVISVEWGAPTYKAYNLTPQDMWGWCFDRSYTIYDINLRKISEYNDWHHTCEIDQTVWDFWLVPEEKESNFIEKIRI